MRILILIMIKNDIMLCFPAEKSYFHHVLHSTNHNRSQNKIHKISKFSPYSRIFSQQENRGEEQREALSEHYPVCRRENKVAVAVVMILWMRVAVVREKPLGAAIEGGFWQPRKSPGE